jgi:hypothetical protein
MVEISDPVDQAHYPTLEGAGLICPPRVADDPVPDGIGQVQATAVALQHLDYAQRLLVVPELLAEAL